MKCFSFRNKEKTLAVKDGVEKQYLYSTDLYIFSIRFILQE